MAVIIHAKCFSNKRPRGFSHRDRDKTSRQLGVADRTAFMLALPQGVRSNTQRLNTGYMWDRFQLSNSRNKLHGLAEELWLHERTQC